MNVPRIFLRRWGVMLVVLLTLLISTEGVRAKLGITSGVSALGLDDFQPAALQGFGDRQNGWAWSMLWWNGHLYVGNNHSFHCAETAAINRFFPSLTPYPPNDPDIECTPDPANLDLRAEIWRWTPETNAWERVYQSPNDIAIPDHPGKFVARDIGYRGMNTFTDPDGTEALYVAGVSSQFLWPTVPPPRILRSADGLHFEPVPQDPGTFLGDFQGNGFRNQTSYNGRFYIVGGVIQGSGVLLEAENPAGGNDNFRTVSPPDMTVSAVQSFNGHLYVGVRDLANGYSVVETDATGTPPYTYTTVVPPGAYLSGLDADSEVLDMRVFNNHLYVGGNGLHVGLIGLMGPAELIRINPDDTWDVVVGEPRNTPNGMKYPISGFDAGFGSFFNGHMWRLEAFDGNLYVGTFDSSTTLKDDPILGPMLQPLMGFDLYRTPNGSDFFPITTDGFGDKFNFGARSLAATPYGLFLGTANYYYGLQIWQTTAAAGSHKSYLPLIMSSSTSGLLAQPSPVAGSAEPSPPPQLQPPGWTETEVMGDAVVVSWEPVASADHYRIVRSDIATVDLPAGLSPVSLPEEFIASDLAVSTAGSSNSSDPVKAAIWSPPEEAGTTTAAYFVDLTTTRDQRYVYWVEAVDSAGKHSMPSNIAAAPLAEPLETFSGLAASLVEMHNRGYLSLEGEREIRQALATALAQCQASDFAGAIQRLSDLRQRLDQNGQTYIAAWKAEDLSRLLRKLERRVQLAQAGLVQPAGLFGDSAPGDIERIDNFALDQLAANGRANVFVKMAADASLEAATTMLNRAERRQFVYDALTAQAAQSQAAIRSFLDSRGFRYRPFWINNSLYIYDADLALVQDLARRTDVAYVRGDHQVPLLLPVAQEASPEDVTAVEWGVHKINADAVWATGNTGQGVVVASIDTGVRYSHEALVKQYRGNNGDGTFSHDYNWFDAVGGQPVPYDNGGHGTHTMGTMVGGDGPGPQSNDIGVAPGAKWIAAKACGVIGCSDADLIAAAQWIACPTRVDGSNPDCSKAPDVVNNSWGAPGGDPFYRSYVGTWLAAGIMPVFAIGNTGPSCRSAGSPGDYRYVIGVGATDSADVLAPFSSKGPGVFRLLKPDFVAPGAQVRSSFNSGDTAYATLSGTSMAAPHVSGAIALMMSANPSAGLAEIYTALRTTTATGLGNPPNPDACLGRRYNVYPNTIYGWGRIDAFAAVNALP